jgi:hypothetical protein
MNTSNPTEKQNPSQQFTPEEQSGIDGFMGRTSRSTSASEVAVSPVEARERQLIDLMKKAEQLTPDQINQDIIANKELRRDLDAQLQKLKGLRGSRHRSLAITHLEDVIMRLGMDLKRLNELSPTPEPRPYPSSYDPSTTKVEPTAEGLKL